MERIEYSRTHFARILGLSVAELALLEREQFPEVSQGAVLRRGARELSRCRAAIKKRPPVRTLRRQLFLNFKGGTGKTSLSSSYAYRLAEMGYRVLVVDLDSQGHAANCLGYEAEEREKTLFDVLVKKVPLSEVLIHCPLTELQIVPSNLAMSTVDLALMPMHGREYRLRQALEALEPGYEFIVMDAPPSFGLLNLNALLAADDLFIPVLADFLSFHGLKLLFETISGLEQDLQLGLERIFVVINQFNPSTRIAKQARDALEQHYRDYLLGTVIRQCTRFAQASSEGIPLSAFDPGSKAAEDIEAMIAEVLPRTQGVLKKEKKA
jgi:chromosome partitioning protein